MKKKLISTLSAIVITISTCPSMALCASATVYDLNGGSHMVGCTPVTQSLSYSSFGIGLTTKSKYLGEVKHTLSNGTKVNVGLVTAYYNHDILPNSDTAWVYVENASYNHYLDCYVKNTDYRSPTWYNSSVESLHPSDLDGGSYYSFNAYGYYDY